MPRTHESVTVEEAIRNRPTVVRAPVGNDGQSAIAQPYDRHVQRARARGGDFTRCERARDLVDGAPMGLLAEELDQLGLQRQQRADATRRV